MSTTTGQHSVDEDLGLPDRTSMDAVTLYTADLGRLSAYYRDAFGLDVLQVAGSDAVLGHDNAPLVVLRHTPGLPRSRPGESGLFHTALLFPDQHSLAASLAQAARHPLSRYAGAADHLVSEAFYFTDPDGNGVELYRDRPRAEWTWRDGRVEMASLPLDPGAFLDRHLQESAVRAAEVGHVHLKVGDIAAARAFYVDTLGFQVTAEWDSALFVSAGGYHHHMAMNTWQSAGAGPRAATLGLGQVTITVPGRDSLDALAARLAQHGVPVRDDGRTLRFEDPWRSQIEVSAG